MPSPSLSVECRFHKCPLCWPFMMASPLTTNNVCIGVPGQAVLGSAAVRSLYRPLFGNTQSHIPFSPGQLLRTLDLPELSRTHCPAFRICPFCFTRSVTGTMALSSALRGHLFPLSPEPVCIVPSRSPPCSTHLNWTPHCTSSHVTLPSLGASHSWSDPHAAAQRILLRTA